MPPRDALGAPLPRGPVSGPAKLVARRLPAHPGCIRRGPRYGRAVKASDLPPHVVQAFIAERDYVDHFTEFTMTFDGKPTIEAIAKSTAILISADQHDFQPLSS